MRAPIASACTVFGLTGSEMDRGLGVHCDLISKIPRPSQTTPFARMCYEPLAATQLAALQALGDSLVLANEDHAGVTSERLLFAKLAPEAQAAAMPALADAVHAYLNQWVALHELGDLLRLPAFGSVVDAAHAPPPTFAAAPRLPTPPRHAAAEPFPVNSEAEAGSSHGSSSSPPSRSPGFTRSPASAARISDLVDSLWQFSAAVAATQRAASAAFFDGSPELLDSLDRSMRARLFSPENDPFWAYIERLLGEQAAAALHDLLCDG